MNPPPATAPAVARRRGRAGLPALRRRLGQGCARRARRPPTRAQRTDAADEEPASRAAAAVAVRPASSRRARARRRGRSRLRRAQPAAGAAGRRRPASPPRDSAPAAPTPPPPIAGADAPPPAIDRAAARRRRGARGGSQPGASRSSGSSQRARRRVPRRTSQAAEDLLRAPSRRARRCATCSKAVLRRPRPSSERREPAVRAGHRLPPARRRGPAHGHARPALALVQVTLDAERLDGRGGGGPRRRRHRRRAPSTPGTGSATRSCARTATARRLEALRAALDIRGRHERPRSAGAHPEGAWPTSAAWPSSSVSHFHVRYDGEEHEAVGREILRALERHYATLASALDYQPADTITVILFTREGYYNASGAPRLVGRRLRRHRRPHPHPHRRPHHQPHADMDGTLIHELTHAFVADRTRGVAPRDDPRGPGPVHGGQAPRVRCSRASSSGPGRRAHRRRGRLLPGRAVVRGVPDREPRPGRHERPAQGHGRDGQRGRGLPPGPRHAATRRGAGLGRAPPAARQRPAQPAASAAASNAARRASGSEVERQAGARSQSPAARPQREEHAHVGGQHRLQRPPPAARGSSRGGPCARAGRPGCTSWSLPIRARSLARASATSRPPRRSTRPWLQRLRARPDAALGHGVDLLVRLLPALGRLASRSPGRTRPSASGLRAAPRPSRAGTRRTGRRAAPRVRISLVMPSLS